MQRTHEGIAEAKSKTGWSHIPVVSGDGPVTVCPSVCCGLNQRPSVSRPLRAAGRPDPAIRHGAAPLGFAGQFALLARRSAPLGLAGPGP